jgi:hypothetical protein
MFPALAQNEPAILENDVDVWATVVDALDIAVRNVDKVNVALADGYEGYGVDQNQSNGMSQGQGAEYLDFFDDFEPSGKNPILASSQGRMGVQCAALTSREYFYSHGLLEDAQ